ncbi:MAG: hypothetical protein GX256_03660 [Fretibacterium sp.]|nr:hypothetical protein [Fretibacterium sp.]
MKGFYRYRVSAALLLFAVLGLSLWSLGPRRRAEQENRNVGLIADFRDVFLVARSSKVPVLEALSLLKEKGLSLLMVNELTGQDSENGFGPRLTPVRDGGPSGENAGTEVSLPNEKGGPLALSLLLARTGGTLSDSGSLPSVRVPATIEALRTTGILPDFEGLEAGVKAGLPLFYRVAPALPWQTQEALAAFEELVKAYPSISLVAPSGEMAVGYPNMGLLASLCREKEVPVAQVEFSRQLGGSMLESLSGFNLIPLHSVTNEELLARRIGRTALRDRMIRAVVERSVRLLVLRPSFYDNKGGALEDFAGELSSLADELRSRGFVMKQPTPLFSEVSEGSYPSLPAALSCAVMLGLACWSYAHRWGLGGGRRVLVLWALVSLSAGVAAWKIPSAARLLGAFAAVFASTEAALMAMDMRDGREIWRTLPLGFFFAVVGGLSIAALFSEPLYMLRLRTFSGVKLTLLLPPLLVLLHDLRNRLHPESLRELLSRPPLWGELLLCGVLVLGLGLVLFRSDNVQFIPGFEAKLRVLLEKTLVARPRSKELFLGYPSLFLLSTALSLGLWRRYREVLRIGVVLGFSSVVNSFCHFHTPLDFILLREFNGLWTGALLGFLVAAALRWGLLPLCRRARFLIE